MVTFNSRPRGHSPWISMRKCDSCINRVVLGRRAFSVKTFEDTHLSVGMPRQTCRGWRSICVFVKAQDQGCHSSGPVWHELEALGPKYQVNTRRLYHVIQQNGRHGKCHVCQQNSLVCYSRVGFPSEAYSHLIGKARLVARRPSSLSISSPCFFNAQYAV